MLDDFYREKLVNAFIYFVKNINRANTTKLMKLLHYFDFLHFKQTGIPALGLEYYTFQRGPVPKEFWLEIKEGNLPLDLKRKIFVEKVEKDDNPDYKEYIFKVKQGIKPNLEIFTPKELDILKDLVYTWKDATAEMMTEATHFKGTPWEKTKSTKGLNQLIDYFFALDMESPISKEQAQFLNTEFGQVFKNFNRLK